MCFPRKASLGHYSGTRAEWVTAYRAARMDERAGTKPDPKHKGLRWKAALIVAFERQEHADPLAESLSSRKLASDIIDEILDKRA